jgi:hypothetical protein
VIAPLFITVPWDSHFDQALDPASCQNATDITNNLTQHTNYSCLSAVDFGYVYGTHSADYAQWDGTQCISCQVAGNVSDWKWVPKAGAISYSRIVAASERSYRKMMKWDLDGDGKLDEADMAASIRATANIEKKDSDDEHSDDEHDDDPDDDDDKNWTLENPDLHTALEQQRPVQTAVKQSKDGFSRDFLHHKTESLGVGSEGAGGVYILKSFNFGSGMINWTYTLMPPHIGVPNFVTDPTNQTVIYTVNAGCIAASYDTGDTWSPCWNQPSASSPPTGHAGLIGSFGGMAIRNSTHMIVTRNSDVPLRTVDGGANWTPVESCRLVANMGHGMLYSWTAETLIMMGSGGTPTADHPHAPFVWVSKDDGETWVDETGGLVTMGPGAANWYENDFYINSMGEGIMVKTLE